MNIDTMTREQMAEYIGPAADDILGDLMIRRLRALGYAGSPADVPDDVWERAVESCVRECAGSLAIVDSGANDAEIAAGIDAARAVFDSAGVNAQGAHAAFLALSEGEDLDDAERAAATAWQLAEAAAITACCAGWTRIPPTAHLELFA